MTECAICFDDITSQTGKTVLSCGHEFHMLCVIRWFQGQEGPSSCPYCRHEAGQLDNLPMAEDEAESNSDSEGEDEDEEESNSEGEEEADENIEVVWFRTHDGTWIRHWREEVAPRRWKPDPLISEDIPSELTSTATSIQAAWRGHTIRSDVSIASILLSLQSIPTK